MSTSKSIIASLFLLASACSSGPGPSEPSANQQGKLDNATADGASSVVTPDPCDTVRVAADGKCDPDGTYFACDPDCAAVDPLPSDPTGEGGAANDPCAGGFVLANGECDESIAACDPDCHESDAPPADDPCVAGFVIANGECEEAISACDPDCQAPEIDPSSDPCATVKLAADGECDAQSPYQACDPDCQ